MYRSHFVADIGPELDGKEVLVAGWVHLIRDLGGKKFIILRDKTGLGQIVVEKNSNAYKVSEELTQESVIQVRGVVRADVRAPRGAEVHATEMRVLNKAKAPLPLDVSGKVKADIDTRLRERVLDLRRQEMQAVIKIQTLVLKAFRETLYKEGFVEIFTPKIIATATEGGAQLFPVIYFGKEAFLAQSPQLYKELMAGVIERVFEIAPAWRAEESDTPFHLSEFISMDVEMAFADYNDVMNLLEKIIYNIVTAVRDQAKEELKILNYEPPNISLPLKRLTYTEAVEILRGKGYNIKFGDDIGTPELRILNEELKENVYYIIDWPSETRPFYTKSKDENPQLSESFDLVYKHIEIASGSTRNHKKEVLEQKLKERGLKPESFEFFLKWFDYGMPPHAGFGMGLQRLMVMLTGIQNIKEITLFPRDKKRLVP